MEKQNFQPSSQKDLFCWHCLRYARAPKPHHIQDYHELLHRPELQRKILLPAYGINVHELASVYNKNRTRELSAHQLDSYGWNLSLMNRLDGRIHWKEEAGEAVPYCPYCHKSLLHQKKWDFLKGWIKYPLLLLGIGVSLWLLNFCLGEQYCYGDNIHSNKEKSGIKRECQRERIRRTVR